MVIAIPAIPFALGSWWAVPPGLVYAAAIMRRVAVEDRYLRQHLTGYAEYTHQVRHRLVPGAW
jgi:protein-S-isoprenylcysteine O-methyltransferase Ste14